MPSDHLLESSPFFDWLRGLCLSSKVAHLEVFGTPAELGQDIDSCHDWFPDLLVQCVISSHVTVPRRQAPLKGKRVRPLFGQASYMSLVDMSIVRPLRSARPLIQAPSLLPFLYFISVELIFPSRSSHRIEFQTHIHSITRHNPLHNMHTHLSLSLVLSLVAAYTDLCAAQMVTSRAPLPRATASAATTGLDTSGATMIKLFEWRESVHRSCMQQVADSMAICCVQPGSPLKMNVET